MADRLDYEHNHPRFDFLSSLDEQTCYEVGRVQDAVVHADGIVSGTTPPDLRYDEGGVLFLGAGNIRDGKLLLEEAVRIPADVHEGRLRASQLTSDDVLVSMAGHVGRCCLYDLDDAANINQAIARLRCDTERVRPKYLLRYLESPLGQSAFTKYRHVVGQPNINLDEISQMPLILPQPAVQDEILSLLQPIEDSIEQLHRRSRELRQQSELVLVDSLNLTPIALEFFFSRGMRSRTTVFSAYLDAPTDRLNVFHYEPAMAAVVAALGAKYRLVPLHDIVKSDIRRGEQPQYVDDGVAVLKTVDLTNGELDLDEAMRVSTEFFRSNPDAHVRRGNVLMASTGYGSLGKVDVYDSDGDCMVDGHIAILDISDDYDPWFIAAFLRSALGKAQIETSWSGSSGQIELPPAELGRILIPSAEDLSLAAQKRISQAVLKPLQESNRLLQLARDASEDLERRFQTAILN